MSSPQDVFGTATNFEALAEELFEVGLAIAEEAKASGCTPRSSNDVAEMIWSWPIPGARSRGLLLDLVERGARAGFGFSTRGEDDG